MVISEQKFYASRMIACAFKSFLLWLVLFAYYISSSELLPDLNAISVSNSYSDTYASGIGSLCVVVASLLIILMVVRYVFFIRRIRVDNMLSGFMTVVVLLLALPIAVTIIKYTPYSGLYNTYACVIFVVYVFFSRQIAIFLASAYLAFIVLPLQGIFDVRGE